MFIRIYIIIYIAQKMMADFEQRQLYFAKSNNFSEGSSGTKKDTQVIRVWGTAAPRVF